MKSFIVLALLLLSFSLLAKPKAQVKKVSTPATAGKATPVPSPTPEKISEEPIMGYDENSDGIRDDIEKWIQSDIPKPNEKEALKQIAKYLQKNFILLNDKDKNKKALIENNNNLLKSYGCLHSVHNSDFDKTNTYSGLLQSKFFNTEGRKKKNEEIQNKLKELKAPAPVPKDEPVCEFKLK